MGKLIAGISLQRDSFYSSGTIGTLSGQVNSFSIMCISFRFIEIEMGLIDQQPFINFLYSFIGEIGQLLLWRQVQLILNDD